MWRNKEDNSEAIITAYKHILSAHKKLSGKLPETAILFFMNSGVEYANEHYKTKLITSNLPTFLNSREVYEITGKSICFMHGGWGAPMAVDTIETLSALGVKNIISVGMFGVFDEKIECGEIIVPDKAFVEEGTSLHYYESLECSTPNKQLFEKAKLFFKNARSLPIVTTDAVYRQTFFKEKLWREKGAVGVDMETSALFSVGSALGMNVVSVLIASDKHPINPEADGWQWKMPKEMRYYFIKQCVDFALDI